MSSGACVATVLLKDGELHVANAGDCRVVMSRKGVANVLTSDHHPGREDERVRIESSVNLFHYFDCDIHGHGPFSMVISIILWTNLNAGRLCQLPQWGVESAGLLGHIESDW